MGNRVDVNLLKSLQKEYGKDNFRFANNLPPMIADVSTGSAGLDFAIGGGLYKGRVAKFAGWEGSGKTTLALHCIREAQQAGMSTAFMDVEATLNREWARSIGVNIDDLLVMDRLPVGEPYLDATVSMAKEGVGMIVIDSLAALLSTAVANKKVGEASMAEEARMLSRFFKIVTPNIARSGTILIVLNQLREKIGVAFGNPEVEPGGHAPQFASALNLNLSRGSKIKDGTSVIGQKTTVTVKKNKMYPPHVKAQYDILYGSTEDSFVGIDDSEFVMDFGVANGVLIKQGNSVYHGDTKLGGSKSVIKSTLRDNPELCKIILESTLPEPEPEPEN